MEDLAFTTLRGEFVTWAMIISMAVSIALSAASTGLQMILAPKPKPMKTPDLGDRGQTITQRQPIGAWRFIYGETRVGLHPLYMSATEGNQYFHIVGAAACHEIDGFGTIYVKDRPVYTGDLDGNGEPTKGAFINSSHAVKYLRVKTKLGTADQTAFDDLVAESGGEWTANHRCRGHALLYTRHRFSAEIYASGLPNVSAVIRGKKVYDPRDAGTRYSPNFALCLRDYLLTPVDEGGFGAAADEIDETNFSAAANICDEIADSPTTGDAAVTHGIQAVSASGDTIDLDGERLKFQRGDRVTLDRSGSITRYVIPVQEQKDDGDQSQDIRYPRIQLATTLANAYAGTAEDLDGTETGPIVKTGEPRFALNGTFTSDQPPRKIIEEMLSCCGGRLVYAGGKFRLSGLAWVAPTLTLDEDDCRGAFKVQTKRSRRDRFNAIKGTYLSPLNAWQPSDWPAITVPSYEAEDLDVRIFNEFDQPYTSRPGQAQRVAKLMLARNRFERILRLPAKLTAYDCKPGEIIAVTNARWGWTAKPFEVLNRKPVIVDDEGGPYLGLDLTLNEASEDAYDWASSEEQADAPVIAPTLPDWANIPAPGTPAVSEYLYEGRDGSDVKAVARLEWAASPSALITGYETEFWPSTGTEDDAEAFATPTTAAVLLAERPDIEPGKYVFRVRGTTSLGAKTNWSTTAAIEIFGLTAAPAAIESLTLQKLGGQALLRWDLHTDADVRRGGWIEFRHCPDESGADESESTTIGDRVDGRSTVAAMPLKAGTYFARAVDKLGNPGPWEPVSTDGALQLSYSTIGSIVEDPTFSGTHSGSVMVGGALKIDGATLMDAWGAIDDIADWDSEGGIAAEATYTFSAVIDLGSVQRGRLRSHLRALVDNTLDLVDDRESNIDDWEDFDGVAPGSADAWVEFRQTPDDPAGAPSWTDWQRVDVTEVNNRAYQLRCQLRSYDPAYNILVTELRAYFEDPAI